MQATAIRRINVDEYYRMAVAGILRPDERVELLDGQIIPMSPIGPFHADVVTYLTEAFCALARRRWEVRTQNPVRLDDLSEPQPDLMLIKRSPGRLRRHPQPGDVYLLVEVCDTTLESDRLDKLPAYARAGIPEVWLVNLNDQTIEVYRQPQPEGFVFKTILRAGDKAAPQSFPDAAIDVEELLQR